MIMIYDISIKNFNNVEVFRGQNLTEELTKQVLDKYTHFPIVNVWQSPKSKEERSEMFNNSLSINITNDECAMKCAKFLKDRCLNIESCKDCIFCRNGNCMIDDMPDGWLLEEGEQDE